MGHGVGRRRVRGVVRARRPDRRLADDDEKSRCAGADQDLSGFHPHHATAGAAVHRLLRFRAGMELEFGCDRRMRVRLRFVGRR